jgi:hypothetical protein
MLKPMLFLQSGRLSCTHVGYRNMNMLVAVSRCFVAPQNSIILRDQSISRDGSNGLLHGSRQCEIREAA